MNKSWKRVIKRIAVGLLIFVALLGVFATFFLKDIVNNQLQKQIKSTFGDFYQLSYEGSSTALSTSGFSINFERVLFEADTSNQLMMRKYPAIFFNTDLLEITDINVIGLLLNSKVAVKNIEIDDPKLLFYITGSGEASDSTESNTQSDNLIESIKVGHISIDKGSASFIFEKSRTDTLFSGKDLSLEIENLGLDLRSEENIVRTGTLDQLAFSIKELRMSPKGSDYNYGIEALKFNYKDQLFQCSEFSLEPVGNPAEMAANNQYRKSILRIKVDSLAYQSDDFKSLKNLTSINGQALNIMGINLIIDRDKRLPLDQTVYKKLFHESLLELPIAVNLDSINVSNARIDYRVHNASSTEPGNLLLSSVDGNITNINTKDLSQIEAKFNGIFMEDGPFNLNIQLPLATPHNHSYDGFIGKTDFASINPLIANLTKVRMEEGWIERIDFDGKGSEYLNQGVMKIAFHDLKLSVTNENNKKKWIQSGLGNLITRNNNRTDESETADQLEYSYERPHYKDHLDMYGGGLINGFALGILPKPIYNLVMNN